MRCWQCGIEPAHLADITTYGDPKPRYIPRWPAPTDHEHTEHPPVDACIALMPDDTLVITPGNWLARAAIQELGHEPSKLFDLITTTALDLAPPADQDS